MVSYFSPKKGRPREYSLTPIPGIPDQNLSEAAAMLHELRERVVDQVVDLPLEALTFRPAGTTLSIGVLAVHLVWAEAGWIGSITGCDIPSEFRNDINAIGQALPEGIEPPVCKMNADRVVKLIRRIGPELTEPALSEFTESIDLVIYTRNRTMTPRGVLMHLVWHWAYHSAHIGLLREQWGSDYTWTFGSLGA
jgi:uncharacterized damage-inducible protein DinB